MESELPFISVEWRFSLAQTRAAQKERKAETETTELKQVCRRQTSLTQQLKVLPCPSFCVVVPLQAHYLSMPSFVVPEVSIANHALGPLLLWVKAMVTFSLFRHARNVESPQTLGASSKVEVSLSAACPRQPGELMKGPPPPSAKISPSPAARASRNSQPSSVRTAARAWEDKLGLWRSELAARIIASVQKAPPQPITQGSVAAQAEPAEVIASSPVAKPDLARRIPIIRAHP